MDTIPGRQVCPGGEWLPFTISRTKSTNQRRNSIQKTPTRTKLAKPKMASTMVILAAFYILLTHICSALYSMPRDQPRRSNAFSPRQELPFSGQHKSEKFHAGCWHTTHTITTIISVNLRIHPRKHTRYKEISRPYHNMPTTRDILVSSAFDTSGDAIKSDYSSGSSEQGTATIHALPCACPTQLGIKYIEGHNSGTTLLMGLTTFMEIIPAFIDGFQLLPLGNPSTLPPLTSNSNIPKTAALAFQYFKVKNMSNMRGATTSPASAQISPARHNDDEEFKPPTMLWGVVRVWGNKNKKEAIDAVT